jgi:hypothetical protein
MDDPSALDGDAGFIGTRTLGAVEFCLSGIFRMRRILSLGMGRLE